MKYFEIYEDHLTIIKYFRHLDVAHMLDMISSTDGCSILRQQYFNVACVIFLVLTIFLGIEFYLFVSHGGMNDRVSTCTFRNARILIFILYQNCPVLAMKYPFLNTQQGGIRNSRRSSRLICHACRFMEKWMSKFFLCLS